MRLHVQCYAGRKAPLSLNRLPIHPTSKCSRLLPKKADVVFICPFSLFTNVCLLRQIVMAALKHVDFLPH
jgi:hypothetical protein